MPLVIHEVRHAVNTFPATSLEDQLVHGFRACCLEEFFECGGIVPAREIDPWWHSHKHKGKTVGEGDEKKPMDPWNNPMQKDQDVWRIWRRAVLVRHIASTDGAKLYPELYSAIR